MPLKWSIKIPSHASAAIVKKLEPLAKKARTAALPKVAARVVDAVCMNADAKLKSTAWAYKQAIQSGDTIKLAEDHIEIAIKDPLVRAIELGSESFDLKEAMLKHAKKFSKDGGPYIDVPFQHAISATSVHMQAMPAEVAAAMKAAVAKEQKQLKAAGATPEQVATATVRLKQKTPGKTFERNLVVGGKTITTTVQHKRGIHDDMIRTAVMGAKKPITKYTTIRRISGNSDPTAWWHPGFKGLGIIKATMPALRKDIEAIIRDSFGAVGLKVSFK